MSTNQQQSEKQQTKKLFILFGFPAAGKSYISALLQKEFGFYSYDGDNDLTKDMNYALAHKQPINDEMRNEFFTRLIKSIVRLSEQYDKLVVAQTFIKEKYRQQLLQAIPYAEFILVETPENIRKKRLLHRTEYPLDLSYAKQMVTYFEKPKIRHTIVVNEANGSEEVYKQLMLILEK